MDEPVDVSGELALVTAIFCRIRRDLHSKNKSQRAEAKAFCEGRRRSIFFWAEMFGVDTQDLRARLMRKG